MKNCSNCCHRDISIKEEPCRSCIYGTNWETNEDTKDLREDKISSKEFIKGFGG